MQVGINLMPIDERGFLYTGAKRLMCEFYEGDEPCPNPAVERLIYFNPRQIGKGFVDCCEKTPLRPHEREPADRDAVVGRLKANAKLT